MKNERTTPNVYFFLMIFMFLKNVIVGCLRDPRRFREFCFRILDFDCRETSDYVRHVRLTDLFPKASVPAVPVYTPLEKGWATMTFDETVCLSTLVQILAPRVIFEIGTFRGYTIRALARNAPEDCKVYTLDLPPDEFGQGASEQRSPELESLRLSTNHEPAVGDIYLKDPIAAPRITQFLESSDAFDYTPFHGKVDLFLVDGAHSYYFVRNDTAHALRCLSDNGVVVWHDLSGGFRGMVRFFKEFGRSHDLYHIIGTSLVLYWPNGIPSLDHREAVQASLTADEGKKIVAAIYVRRPERNK